MNLIWPYLCFRLGSRALPKLRSTVYPARNQWRSIYEAQECCDEPRGFVGAACDMCGGTVIVEPQL